MNKKDLIKIAIVEKMKLQNTNEKTITPLTGINLLIRKAG